MKMMTGRLLAAMGGIAVLCAAFAHSAVGLTVPQTRAVHTVAGQADDREGGDDTSGRMDKSEPTRSGLYGTALFGTDLGDPGAAVNGLAATVARVALSPNRTLVQSEVQSVAAGQVSDTEVTCPYPFKVVHGGESNNGFNVRLTKNYPVTTPSSSGWHAQVHNDDPETKSYRVYADCINGLTQYQRVVHPNQDIAPGAAGRDDAACPAGTRPLGGGYSLESPARVAVTGSSEHKLETWRVEWRNVGSSLGRISTYAICAAGVNYLRDEGAVSNGSGEYERVETGCGADESFAGGWDTLKRSEDSYITVTDSYPTAEGHVVYARNHNQSAIMMRLNCGTSP